MIEKSGNSLTKTLQAVAKTKLHEQIVNQVQALIEKGRLKHGDQLPPEEDSQSPYRNKLSIEGHNKILDAIKDADSRAANKLMAGHLDAIRELVLSSNVEKKE